MKYGGLSTEAGSVRLTGRRDGAVLHPDLGGERRSDGDRSADPAGLRHGPGPAQRGRAARRHPGAGLGAGRPRDAPRRAGGQPPIVSSQPVSPRRLRLRRDPGRQLSLVRRRHQRRRRPLRLRPHRRARDRDSAGHGRAGHRPASRHSGLEAAPDHPAHAPARARATSARFRCSPAYRTCWPTSTGRACASASQARIAKRRSGGRWDRAARRFTHYACGASLFGKARRLRALIRDAGVAPSETLYVGDEIRDHQAATEAGCAFGAVAWGYTRADALAARTPAHLFVRPGRDPAAASCRRRHRRPEIRARRRFRSDCPTARIARHVNAVGQAGSRGARRARAWTRRTRSQPTGTAAVAGAEGAGGPPLQARGARSHFLVACLAGGLQAAYAPQPEARSPDCSPA